MNEIELLYKLVELDGQQHELKIRIDVWHDDEKVHIYKKKLIEVEKERGEITQQLIDIKDRPYSHDARKGMISQLGAYVTEINKAKTGFRLTRNQGLMLENHLFSKILSDLQHFITSDFVGYFVPLDLHYTYSQENSIEISTLTKFLESGIKTLAAIEDPDYVKLRHFYKNFEERMIEQFIR